MSKKGYDPTGIYKGCTLRLLIWREASKIIANDFNLTFMPQNFGKQCIQALICIPLYKSSSLQIGDSFKICNVLWANMIGRSELFPDFRQRLLYDLVFQMLSKFVSQSVIATWIISNAVIDIPSIFFHQ